MNVLPRAVDLRRARARRARRREPSGRHCSPMDLLHFMPHAQNRRERSAARPSCEAVLRGLYGNFLDPCGLRIKLSSRIDEKTTCRAEPDALSGTSGVLGGRDARTRVAGPGVGCPYSIVRVLASVQASVCNPSMPCSINTHSPERDVTNSRDHPYSACVCVQTTGCHRLGDTQPLV